MVGGERRPRRRGAGGFTSLTRPLVSASTTAAKRSHPGAGLHNVGGDAPDHLVGHGALVWEDDGILPGPVRADLRFEWLRQSRYRVEADVVLPAVVVQRIAAAEHDGGDAVPQFLRRLRHFRADDAAYASKPFRDLHREGVDVGGDLGRGRIRHRVLTFVPEATMSPAINR